MFVHAKVLNSLLFKALSSLVICWAIVVCLIGTFDSTLVVSAKNGDGIYGSFVPMVAVQRSSAQELPMGGDYGQDILLEDLIAQGVWYQEVTIASLRTTYYVDCDSGSDNHDGMSSASAWQTLEKANSVTLLPGDRLRFKRDCTWIGPLEARWQGNADQPILISSYGKGALPKIINGYSSNVRITGSYLIIENLHTTLSFPPNPDPNCANQPIGWKAGFSFQDGAAHNIVQHSAATGLAIGIFFSGDTHHNKALNNRLTKNNVVWELTPDRTLGAMGILLQGDSQEVGYNFFADNGTICTYTGVIESNSIELYAATNATIHHNMSYRDRVFSELGSSPSARSENNTYAYNLFVNDLSAQSYGARFLVTRGWEHPHGPVLGTRVFNNTIYLTGSGSKGVTCEKCGPNVLSMENNILWVNREPFWSDGPFVEKNNIYWDGTGSPLLHFYGFSINNTSLMVDPGFVDVDNRNFGLMAQSPAIDSGAGVVVDSGLDYDLWQTSIPVGGVADIGAYEYRQAPWQRVFALPSRIEAENYGSGDSRNSTGGYYDTTAGNSGGVYRNDDVDIQATTDEGGGYNVGWMAPGEWLTYEINAPATGTYQVIARVSTHSGGRSFHLEIDDNDLTGAIYLPWTNGWQSWVDVPVFIPIKAGRHTLKVVSESDRFNINYLLVSKIQ